MDIALAKYSQMSTHVPGFLSLFRFFASFCIGQISHQQPKGEMKFNSANSILQTVEKYIRDSSVGKHWETSLYNF